MSKQAPDPTPAEIAAICTEIQLTWTADERQRRLRADWQPVVGTCDGRTLQVTAADYEVSLAGCPASPVTALGEKHAQCVAMDEQRGTGDAGCPRTKRVLLALKY